MMGPLSVLPTDLHHSGLLIKPPFTKPKQGKKEGEKGWEYGKAKGMERQLVVERVKGRKERVMMEFWKGEQDG